MDRARPGPGLARPDRSQDGELVEAAGRGGRCERKGVTARQPDCKIDSKVPLRESLHTEEPVMTSNCRAISDPAKPCPILVVPVDDHCNRAGTTRHLQATT